MRRTTTIFIIGLCLAVFVSLIPGMSSAHVQDLAITRFIDCSDPEECYPKLSEYEQFLAEYAFGLSPKNLTPAETLGYSGFYLGIEGTVTPRPKNSTEIWEKGTIKEDFAPGAMFMPGIRVRKGLPWSFELGGSLNYLAQSE